MNFICKNCGGNIEFDIKSQSFRCSSCQTPEEIVADNPYVVEHDFAEYKNREQNARDYDGMNTVFCSNCGAEIIFDSNKTATKCPMCSSPNINTQKQISGIAPDGIIPFKIDKQDAQNNFKGWIKRLWFAPNKLKKAYQEGRLDGIYLPFWTFDAKATAHYSGEGGEEYTTKNSEGKTETHVRWTHVSGIVDNFFNDVQICSTQDEANEIVDSILPYSTIDKTLPYSPAYLSGFGAEKYSIKADDAYIKAQDKMHEVLYDMARDDILSKGFDRANVKSLDVHYTNVTYKNVLLPAWLSSFGYAGKKYLYIINGETGKVGGKRPYSAVKIALAIIALILAGVLLYSLDSDAAVLGSFDDTTVSYTYITD